MADTVYKLTHTGEQIDSVIDNAVRSDAQILTSEQQTQARTNIGAADTATCLRSSAQTLTVEQQTQARTNIGAASAADLTTETNKRITADTGVRGLTATVEATSTASQAYAIGDYLVYGGLLYKATAAIAQGGTIVPGSNCSTTTIGSELSALNETLANYFATDADGYYEICGNISGDVGTSTTNIYYAFIPLPKNIVDELSSKTITVRYARTVGGTTEYKSNITASVSSNTLIFATTASALKGRPMLFEFSI